MGSAKFDKAKEAVAYSYLLWFIEQEWGKDGILTQTNSVNELRAKLEATGAKFGRDWHISMDEQAEEVYLDILSIPFISPFFYFCMIAPEDLESRKVIWDFISNDHVIFYYRLATLWVATARENISNKLFTCEVIEKIFDLWCYYKLVDKTYEREKLAGVNKSIKDLRRDCFKIETTKEGTLTKALKLDFGPSGGSIVLQTTECDGKTNNAIEVTITDEDKALFDAFTSRDIDTFTCDFIRLLKKDVAQAAYYNRDGIDSKMILKCGANKKLFKMDLKSRYEDKIKNIAYKRTVKYGGSMEDMDDMKQVGDTALFEAALSGTRGENISEHLYYSILRAIQHEFESISTESDSATRIAEGQSKRVLQSKIERSGGELDSKKTDTEGAEVSTLEWLEGKNARKGYDLYGHTMGETPEDRLATRQVLESAIKDKSDRAILEQLAAGFSQKEIAQQLGISEPAVCKRIKKICDRARDAQANNNKMP